MEARAKLTKGTRAKKSIDMEWVYQELDGGRSVKSVAEELGIGRTTLYRRHREYQKQKEEESQNKEKDFSDFMEDFPQL